jgi:flagella basal body P-ring formation protein FlgA
MKTATAVIALTVAIGLDACNYFPSVDYPRQVIVATRQLPAGTVIKRSDTRIVRVSPHLITPDIPRKKSAVLGHRALRLIPEGELIRLPELSE